MLSKLLKRHFDPFMTILWPFLCLIVTPCRCSCAPFSLNGIWEPFYKPESWRPHPPCLLNPRGAQLENHWIHSRHTGHTGHTPYLFHITQWWICFTEAFESEYQEHLCLHICLNETVPSVVLSSLHVKLCPRGSFAILVYAFTEGEAIFDQETIKHVLFDIYI